MYFWVAKNATAPCMHWKSPDDPSFFKGVVSGFPKEGFDLFERQLAGHRYSLIWEPI